MSASIKREIARALRLLLVPEGQETMWIACGRVANQLEREADEEERAAENTCVDAPPAPNPMCVEPPLYCLCPCHESRGRETSGQAGANIPVGTDAGSHPAPSPSLDELLAYYERAKHDYLSRGPVTGLPRVWELVEALKSALATAQAAHAETLRWHQCALGVAEAQKQRAEAAERESRQLRVQLAGCLTVASPSGLLPEVVAEEGAYGWSVAYQHTLELHRKYAAAESQLARLREPLTNQESYEVAYAALTSGRAAIAKFLELREVKS